ncbi:MAG: glycoside hydrolase family 9 protein [Oscillospiraceae bacterium]|nr:glycoside hydrolase family 9 protein [Oscillospiraceae bacterium]
MKKHTFKKGLTVLTACMTLTAAAQTMAPLSGSAATGINLVTNSTFESGISEWDTYKESGGAGKLSAKDGKLALEVTSLGELNYALQMFYDIIPLYQNGVYRISFDISCTTDRFIEAMIQQNGGTYQAYVWLGLNLTSEEQHFEKEFTMEKDTDIMAKLVFNCGIQTEKDPGCEAGHTIYLDNVVIECIDDSNVDYAAFMPYEPPIVTNQIGYRTNDVKTAVIRGENTPAEFKVVNTETKEIAFSGTASEAVKNTSAGEMNRVADFSSVTTPGKYMIQAEGLDDSYVFEISDNPYQELVDASVRMLYLQRCGCAVEDDTFGHKACHTSEATLYGTSDKIDVSGGWHDAGDYGRYVVPAAKTIADLLYAYDANPGLFTDSIGIPESGNGVPDVLDEARYELEWMLKMQDADGGVHHKVSCKTFPGMLVMPDKETGALIVTPVSSTATADFCASMALAAEFYESFDKTFAATCKAAAEKSWAYLQEHPEFNFKDPADISTGAYNDKSDKDERYWAACQMYRMSGDEKYLADVSVAMNGIDWATVGGYGNIALTTMKSDNVNQTALANAKAAIEKNAASADKLVQANPYGSPLSDYYWGSNMAIANAGIMLAMTDRMDSANEVLNHLLGKNPLGTCYVTGFGTVGSSDPHHRPSLAVGTAQPGMLVGGVNPNLEDSAAKAYCKGLAPAKCYIDKNESYSTNEIAIYWNSPLTYLLAVTEKATEVDPPVVVDPEVDLGDVTVSDGVDVADAVLLARYLAEDASATVSSQGLLNADVDKNGSLTSEDVVTILQYVAKMITEF